MAVTARSFPCAIAVCASRHSPAAANTPPGNAVAKACLSSQAVSCHDLTMPPCSSRMAQHESPELLSPGPSRPRVLQEVALLCVAGLGELHHPHHVGEPHRGRTRTSLRTDVALSPTTATPCTLAGGQLSWTCQCLRCWTQRPWSPASRPTWPAEVQPLTGPTRVARILCCPHWRKIAANTNVASGCEESESFLTSTSSFGDLVGSPTIVTKHRSQQLVDPRLGQVLREICHVKRRTALQERRLSVAPAALQAQVLYSHINAFCLQVLRRCAMAWATLLSILPTTSRVIPASVLMAFRPSASLAASTHAWYSDSPMDVDTHFCMLLQNATLRPRRTTPPLVLRLPSSLCIQRDRCRWRRSALSALPERRNFGSAVCALKGSARSASRVGSRCRSAWPYLDSTPCQRIPSQVGLGKCSSVSLRSDAALPQHPAAPLLLSTPPPRVALWPSKCVCTRWVPAGPAATPAASRVLPSGLPRDSRTSCSAAALVNRLLPPFDGLHRVLRLALDQQAVSVPSSRHVVVAVKKHRRDAAARHPDDFHALSQLVLKSSDAERVPYIAFLSRQQRAVSSRWGGFTHIGSRVRVWKKAKNSLLVPWFVRAGLYSKGNAARSSVGAKIESTLVLLNCLTTSRARMSTFVASPWLVTSQRLAIGAAPITI